SVFPPIPPCQPPAGSDSRGCGLWTTAPHSTDTLPPGMFPDARNTRTRVGPRDARSPGPDQRGTRVSAGVRSAGVGPGALQLTAGGAPLPKREHSGVGPVSQVLGHGYTDGVLNVGGSGAPVLVVDDAEDQLAA